MFDISWSEMLILGVVALIFVGPKDLPVFLRVLGKYTGMVKRQAAEFRAQFDAAMREAEHAADLDALKKTVEDAKRQAAAAMPLDPDFEAPRLDGLMRPCAAAAPPASNENTPMAPPSFPAKSET